MFDQDTEIKIAAITEESGNFLNQTKNSTSSNGSDSILPPLINNPSSGGDDALEQAAKSLQKLYVNPVSRTTSLTFFIPVSLVLI